MFRIEKSVEAVESLIEETFRAVGVSRQDRRWTDDGRVVGVKSTFTATAQVLVDIGVPPTEDSVCYVSVFGRYNSRSQIPYLLGRTTPKVTSTFRDEFRHLAGESIGRV
jgi:hypothetical protein